MGETSSNLVKSVQLFQTSNVDVVLFSLCTPLPLFTRICTLGLQRYWGVFIGYNVFLDSDSAAYSQPDFKQTLYKAMQRYR